VAGSAVCGKHAGALGRLGRAVGTGARGRHVAVAALTALALCQGMLSKPWEPGGRVIEARQGKTGRIEIAPAVIGVAVCAAARVRQMARASPTKRITVKPIAGGVGKGEPRCNGPFRVWQ
jgi:hypothetical protein